MTSFVGGATEPDVRDKPDDEIAAIVQDEKRENPRNHRAAGSFRGLEASQGPCHSTFWHGPHR